MTWQCEGKFQNGTPSQFGQHALQAVNVNACPMCRLTQADVQGSSTSKQFFLGGKRINPWMFIVPVGLVSTAVGAFIVRQSIDKTIPDLSMDDGRSVSSVSGECPFPNCTLKIGSISSRPINSGNNTISSENSSNSTKSPTCADTKLAQDRSSSSASNLVVTSPNSDRRGDREPLRKYLEEQLKKQFPSIQVQLDRTIDATQPNWIADADRKIKNKEWDIAFTFSPLIAGSAKEQNYEFGFARKNSRGDSSFNSSIFVRKDSPIVSLKDITADKTIALGNANDLVGFYLPIYDLYGTTPKIKPNNIMRNIRSMVLCKEVDIGVGSTQSIKENPRLTILTSRSVKAGGVYFSPQLSVEARKIVKDLLSNAPGDIQDSAGYMKDSEPTQSEYDRVQQIKARAREIIDNGSFPINIPVASNTPIKGIIGQVENVRHINKQEYSMAISTDKSVHYQVLIPDEIMQSLSKEPILLIKQRVEIIDIKADENHVLKIAKKEQIVLK
jgi:hypothetical protein